MSNIEYEARWFGDTSDPEPKIQRNFTGLEIPEFLFQPAIMNRVLNKKIGYEFHKNVCRGHAIILIYIRRLKVSRGDNFKPAYFEVCPQASNATNLRHPNLHEVALFNLILLVVSLTKIVRCRFHNHHRYLS